MDIGKVALGIVTFFLGVIEALLGFRFVLKILAANSTAQFTEFVYSSSDPLVSAFQGVFPSFEVAGFTLELHTILAMVAFGVVGVVIIVLLRHFEGVKVKAPQVNPSQPSVQQAPQVPVQMPQQPMVQMPPQPQAPMSAPAQYYQQPPQPTTPVEQTALPVQPEPPQTPPVPEQLPSAPGETMPQQ